MGMEALRSGNPYGTLSQLDTDFTGTRESQRHIFEQVVAAAALILLGMRQFITFGLTTGYVLALLLVPIWIPTLRRYWGGRFLVVCGLIAITAGWLLGNASAHDHATSFGLSAQAVMLLLGTLCGVGVILWARTVLSISLVGLWFGVGMLITAAFSQDKFTANAWKYGWAIPLAVFCLSLARKNKRAEVVVLAFLAGLSVVFDSRSYFATFLISAILVVWQMRPRSLSKRASWVWSALFLAVLAAAVYNLGTTLLVGGYLGQEAQIRSVEQIDKTGSLIVGGRPELAATIALFRAEPMGYGVGVVPNLHDVTTAKQGMAKINYDPNNGYVDKYMFGVQFELHSTTGDIWANFGLAGVILVITMIILVVRGAAESISRRQGSGLLLFLTCWTMWNFLFSPFYSAAPTLMLTLGLGLLPRALARNGQTEKVNLPPNSVELI
jgi:hypothetical protein